MADPAFNRAFDPAYGRAVEITRGICRVTAENPSPYTFHGTNGYLIGNDSLAIIDPGPDDDRHFERLMHIIDGRKLSHILITHTHRDHTPMAHRLKAETGAPIVAEGPHRASRALQNGETNPFKESADLDLVPDIVFRDGDVISAGGFAIEAVHTPGHTANHLAFAVKGTNILFSGDHVMGWSTTMVAPPDGAMSDYMASLEKLLLRKENHYLPGHGGPVKEAHNFVRGIRSHRRMRERAILNRLAAGDHTIAEMVEVIYRTTNKNLHGAASLSVLAHIESLVERGRVSADDGVVLGGRYRLA